MVVNKTIAKTEKELCMVDAQFFEVEEEFQQQKEHVDILSSNVRHLIIKIGEANGGTMH